jgi:XTP/dITP diphosphohydrolase
VADGQTTTTAELDAVAKDAISHRGQAIRAIVPVLIDELRRLSRADPEDPR